jgi:hypothetical protein
MPLTDEEKWAAMQSEFYAPDAYFDRKTGAG